MILSMLKFIKQVFNRVRTIEQVFKYLKSFQKSFNICLYQLKLEWFQYFKQLTNSCS